MDEKQPSIELELRAQIDPARVPRHVAVIMDGNGRWARQRGEERISGHLRGVQPIRDTLTTATEVGVKYLTLYAFSTENWNRPPAEVEALMGLLVNTITNEIEELDANGVRLHTIGDTDSLPDGPRKALQRAMERTAGNDRITLTLALSYSARWDILRMVRRIAGDLKSGKLDPEQVDEELVARHLSTRGLPEPDLLIRTSGEVRVSNFLLWEIAYSELWFTPVLWPDFRKHHFLQAVVDFQQRERRFGLTHEQLSSS